MNIKNELTLNGTIEFIDNTKNAGKDGKEFLVRTIGVDMTEVIRGSRYPNKVKFQMKGNNVSLPDNMDFNGSKYILAIGDEVTISFSCEGMADKKTDTEKMKLAKENPNNYPGNPTGIDFGITNLNCYEIKYYPGYTPKESNKIEFVQKEETNKVSNSENEVLNSNSDDDLPF